MFEDLGVQMNRHSTLVSYLEKLVWVLTGNFANPGGQYVASTHRCRWCRRRRRARSGSGRRAARSPARGSSAGSIPCNVIAEEILTDHPDRYRAMIVESGNPAHSVADSRRMREAIEALDVRASCIDVFMTETARLADYVLPATTQFEKFEATFFNFEFPRNVFHLRRPVLDAAGRVRCPSRRSTPGSSRRSALLDRRRPRAAARRRRRRAATEFAAAFAARDRGRTRARRRRAGRCCTARSARPCPHGAAVGRRAVGDAPSAARMLNPAGVERAGFGSGPDAGERLFDAILDQPVRRRVHRRRPRRHVAARSAPPTAGSSSPSPSCSTSSTELRRPAGRRPEWPFLLSAGERRSFTANTIFRDPAWRKRDGQEALRVATADAERLGLDRRRPRSAWSPSAARRRSRISVDERMHPGHLSLPNGTGTDRLVDGERVVDGVAPNELTHSFQRDRFAGTPWHKTVPARLEVVAS